MSIKVDWASFRKKRTKLVNGFPVGMVLFTGAQGGGKSLSQSRYIRFLQLRHDAKVYSATDYKYADEVVDEFEFTTKLMTPREERPSIFALDEIQVLLERGNITSDGRAIVRKAIQQQRKRNTSIIGTAQELLDLDPIYRRQLKYVVRCSHFGPIQIERWMDGQTLKFDDETNRYKGTTIDIRIWKRNNEIFDLYDTFEVVGDKKTQKPSLAESGSSPPEIDNDEKGNI